MQLHISIASMISFSSHDIAIYQQQQQQQSVHSSYPRMASIDDSRILFLQCFFCNEQWGLFYLFFEMFKKQQSQNLLATRESTFTTSLLDRIIARNSNKP